MLTVTLNRAEMDLVLAQSPATKKDGGFQSLLVHLQENLDRNTGKIVLSDQDLDRIANYAFGYGNGGWEDRLVAMFGRTLGMRLDKRQ